MFRSFKICAVGVCIKQPNIFTHTHTKKLPNIRVMYFPHPFVSRKRIKGKKNEGECKRCNEKGKKIGS